MDSYPVRTWVQRVLCAEHSSCFTFVHAASMYK